MAQVRRRSIEPADRGAEADGRSQTCQLHRVEAATVKVAEMPAGACLTRRERQCLAWCAEGKSYWETAVILGIAERTVSFHMEAVRSKLEAATNAHAVAKAMSAGLFGPNAPLNPPRLQVLR